MKFVIFFVSLLMITSVSHAEKFEIPALTSSSGTRHMFDFTADSVLTGVLVFGKSKMPGEASDDDIQLDTRLNYAYQLSAFPRFQIGTRLEYLKDTASAGDVENWGIQVGGIFNQSSDLLNTMYASLYFGMSWNQEFGAGAGEDDEVLSTIVALGRRYSMEKWGIKHFTYTPEVAFKNRTSTLRGDFSYTQSLELRFLQFSVFF